MFPVSVSGVLLLFLIHHSTLNSVNGQDIDSNTLARIITFFEQNYKKVNQQRQELQYTVAINVPTEQCEAGFNPSLGNFLRNENPACVKCDIAKREYPVYRGTDLIAAGVKRIRQTFSIHAERFLLNPTLERQATPMQDLLNGRTDSCTILYSFNSPCSKICLNEDDPNKILPGIEEWSAHRSIKALVFKQIFIGERSEDILRIALQRIADHVPLYRCKNNNECFSCGGRNNVPIDERCLKN